MAIVCSMQPEEGFGTEERGKKGLAMNEVDTQELNLGVVPDISDTDRIDKGVATNM